MAYFAHAVANMLANNPVPPRAPLPAPQPPRRSKRTRTEVQYREVEEVENASESEEELVPYKKPKLSTKPLPKKKIFPFMSLPGEIRNKIYEECLPAPTKLPDDAEPEEAGLWFHYKQKKHRQTVEYAPEICGEYMLQYGFGRLRGYTPSRGTGRGNDNARQPRININNPESDAENEEEEKASPKLLAFNVLSVCKTIYDEAAPMMYSQKFVFTSPEALFAFTMQLSPRTAKLLRHIEIRSWGMTRTRKTRGYNAMAMLAAKGVTNLETLNINCEFGYYRSYGGWSRSNRKEVEIPKRIARKLHRDCHLWLDAVGAATGQWDRGVQILKFSEEMLEDWIYKRTSANDNVDKYEDVLEESMKMYRKEMKRLLGAGAW